MKKLILIPILLFANLVYSQCKIVNVTGDVISSNYSGISDFDIYWTANMSGGGNASIILSYVHNGIETRIDTTNNPNHITPTITSVEAPFDAIFVLEAWTNPDGGGTSCLRVTLSTPLPVELISFSGNIINEETRLKWETATEINNSGFEIYSSNDGENWNYVSFVSGNGNSTQLNRYNFTDSYNSGKYYRLKQIDYNGQFEFSDIITVSSNNESNIKIEYYSLTGERFYSIPDSPIYIKTIYNENNTINSSTFVRRNN